MSPTRLPWHSLSGRARQSSRPPLGDRTAAGWLVKLELAGVRAGDLSVSVQGPRLTVWGRRGDACAAWGGSHQQMEIAYGRFERIVELPCDLTRCTVATDYRDGMLLIDICQEENEP